MIRHTVVPRKNFKEITESQGLLWAEGYYNEDATYQFSMNEILHLEKATADVFAMCEVVMNAVVEDSNLLNKFYIPQPFHDLIRQSWLEDDFSLYSRFDLAYNAVTGDIKVLEFNADTPTSLLEASVIQWFWLQDFDRHKDQFNSLHEKLLAHFRVGRSYLSTQLTFLCLTESREDYVTTAYLQSLAQEAGFRTLLKDIGDLAVDAEAGIFEEPGDIFKLYPWEWMFTEDFAPYLLSDQQTKWIEPAYKAVWSNKFLMVLLHRFFPDSPYILRADTQPGDLRNFVKKPVFSREGANVSIVKDGRTVAETDGDYGQEGYIYQEYFEIPQHSGYTPILGSWIVGGEPAGIGIRESAGLITDNKSTFVNHFIS